MAYILKYLSYFCTKIKVYSQFSKYLSYEQISTFRLGSDRDGVGLGG